MRFRYMQPILRDGEDGGGSSPAPQPQAQQPQQPPQQQLPIQQPQQPPAQQQQPQRRTEADWRADVAAQRVEREKLEGLIAQKDRDIEAARADAERRVQEVTSSHQTEKQKLQGKLIDTAIAAAATAAGLVDADLIPLMDKSTVKLDDDGNVVGVSEAIEAFKTKKPSFFKDAAAAPAGEQSQPGGQQQPTQQQPSQSGSNRNPPPAQNPPMVDVKAMTKVEYDAWFKGEMRKLRRA